MPHPRKQYRSGGTPCILWPSQVIVTAQYNEKGWQALLPVSAYLICNKHNAKYIENRGKMMKYAIFLMYIHQHSRTSCSTVCDADNQNLVEVAETMAPLSTDTFSSFYLQHKMSL